MKKQTLMLVVALVLPGHLLAQSPGKKRLTMRDMLSLKTISAPVLSPDGRRVAFTLAEVDFTESVYRTDIWVVDTEARKPRPFTRSKENESAPRWSPDGTWLAFLSDRPPITRSASGDASEKGEEKAKNQIWLIPADGGEAFQLTEAEQGVIAYEWLPDGQTLLYLSRESLPPPEKERKERDRRQKIDPIVEDQEKYRREFWTVDVTTKKARRVFLGDYGIGAFDVSADGKRVVYMTNYTGKEDDGEKFDLWVLSLDDGTARQLTRRVGGERSPRWSPDGTAIAFLAPQLPDISYSQTDLFVVSPDGGEPQVVTKDFDRSVESFRWFPDGRSLCGLVAWGVYSPLMRISRQGGQPETITAREAVVSAFDVSRDGSRLVLLVEDAQSPPDLWLWGQGSNGLVRLTEVNPELKEFEIAAQEVIRWKSRDGREIEGVLTLPVGYRPGVRYPLLVAVHGGPHGRTLHTFRQYYSFQVWAANGYAVFSPNFRGSSGYDGAFDIANRGDLGGEDFQDIMTGVDALIARGIADGEKLGIFGGSYGGYMTNWAITQTDRFKAAISMYGIFNLITDFSNSYLPSWEPNYLGGYYWDLLDVYIRRSPFAYVKKIKTPVLILHGEADPNTFISNSKEMYTALKTLGKTVEFVRYPREGHGFREPNHRIDEMQRALAWFARYVKGETPETQEFRIGEKVPAGSWEFEVVSVNPEATYPGVTTEGRFVEISLLFRTTHRESPPLELRLDEQDVILLDDHDRPHGPIGVPVEMSGVRGLVRGAARFTVAATGEPTTYSPLVLTFELGRDRQATALRVKNYAPVLLTK
jgi:dipeptidyl aminopeptidase/acylaminoacyl peptidase